MLFRATVIGSKPMLSFGFSRPARSSPTWNTPWSTRPSSRSTATARAQKGDSEPSHRPLQGRHDDQDPGAHRCARQSPALRLAARPSRRHHRRAALIDGLSFGALIADKVFDSNTITANLNERGAKIVPQHPRRAKPLPPDAMMYKWRER